MILKEYFLPSLDWLWRCLELQIWFFDFLSFLFLIIKLDSGVLLPRLLNFYRLSRNHLLPVHRKSLLLFPFDHLSYFNLLQYSQIFKFLLLLIFHLLKLYFYWIINDLEVFWGFGFNRALFFGHMTNTKFRISLCDHVILPLLASFLVHELLWGHLSSRKDIMTRFRIYESDPAIPLPLLF